MSEKSRRTTCWPVVEDGNEIASRLERGSERRRVKFGKLFAVFVGLDRKKQGRSEALDKVKKKKGSRRNGEASEQLFGCGRQETRQKQIPVKARPGQASTGGLDGGLSVDVLRQVPLLRGPVEMGTLPCVYHTFNPCKWRKLACEYPVHFQAGSLCKFANLPATLFGLGWAGSRSGATAMGLIRCEMDRNCCLHRTTFSLYCLPTCCGLHRRHHFYPITHPALAMWPHPSRERG